jgi:hypothetical protein
MKAIPASVAVMSALLFVSGFAAQRAEAVYVDITVDGDFSDWASVPVAATTSSNPSIPNDLESIRLANNDDYLYLLLTFYSPTNVNNTTGGGTYLALDNDNNTATGFDIFGLGLLGAEAGWQNDFPFEQTNGTFNTGSISGGNALISPYYSVTMTQEYAISRSAFFVSTGAPLFPTNTFHLMAYSVDDGGKILGPVEYTFATVPEPSVVMLFLCGGLIIGRVIKRRHTRECAAGWR